jgi:hypothetical protein
MADPNASVFNMSDFTVTRRVAQNYTDDVKVPINDGVAKGKIDSPSFLTGITAGVAGNVNDGVDQTIIIGDRVEEIRGKQAAKVTLDRDSHIVGSLKTLVDDKEERAVKVSRSTNVGPVGVTVPAPPGTVENLMVQGQRYSYINGTDQLQINAQNIKTVLNNGVSNSATSWFRTGNSFVELFWMRYALTLFNGITCGFRFRSSPVEAKTFLLKSEFGLLKHETAMANVSMGLAKLKVRLADIKTGGFKNWLFPAP